MGAERAVTDSTPGSATLRNFNNEIVAKMKLDEKGKWILMGRVQVFNSDGDRQYATAKLVHDTNVVIDEVRGYFDYLDGDCMYLQAGFIVESRETVTLECNTYNGGASDGSIIAFNVGDIDFQD